jgi:hypothetical protein
VNREEFEKLSPEKKMALMKQMQQSKAMKVGYGNTMNPYGGGGGEFREAQGPAHAPMEVPAQQGMMQDSSRIMQGKKKEKKKPTMEDTYRAGAQTTSTATPDGGSAYGGKGMSVDMSGYVPKGIEAGAIAAQGAPSMPASPASPAGGVNTGQMDPSALKKLWEMFQ